MLSVYTRVRLSFYWELRRKEVSKAMSQRLSSADEACMELTELMEKVEQAWANGQVSEAEKKRVRGLYYRLKRRMRARGPHATGGHPLDPYRSVRQEPCDHDEGSLRGRRRGDGKRKGRERGRTRSGRVECSGLGLNSLQDNPTGDACQ